MRTNEPSLATQPVPVPPGPCSLLGALLEQSADLIAVIDSQLHVRLIGQALARLLREPVQALIGRHVDALVPLVEPAHGLREGLLQVLASGQPQCLEVAAGQSGLYRVHLLLDLGANGGDRRLLMIAQDISAYRRVEDELRQREREFRTLAENSPDNIIRYGLDGRATYCNQEIEGRVKVSSASLVGKTPTEGAPPGMRGAQNYEAQLFRSLATGERGTVELIVEHPTLGERTHSVVISAERNAQGAICGALAVGRDVTEQALIRQALADKEREFRTLAENAGDNIIRWDTDGLILYANPAMVRVLGNPAAAVLGRTVDSLVEHRHFDEAHRAAQEVAASGQARMLEVRVPGPPGAHPQVHQVRLVPERDETGQLRSVLGVGRDITESIVQREFVASLARTDPLTRLANRQALHERAPGLLAAARRRNVQMGVMLLDLDQFKSINDSMGHSAGDELLCEIARRMGACLRAEDLLVRLGGDEFVVVVTDMAQAQATAAIAAKVHEVLRKPFELGRRQVHISASIGVALYPNDGVDLEHLLAHADSAMYHAKHSGRARTEYYRRELSEAVERRVLMEESLHGARHGQGLELHFQPKVALRRGAQLVGAEALLRWRHPSLGLLAPDAFIPLAEETGLIVPMGRWVLHQAAATVVRWNQGRAEPLTMAVNVSTRQFIDDDLPAAVHEALLATGCQPAWLEVEITESALLEDSELVRSVLVALRQMQVRVAIDDFGTGYSALSYLARFDVDCLKIDKSFVQAIELGDRQAELVKAFIAMADALGLHLVAEGVETSAQSQFLFEQGCQVAQGYRFGRPASGAEFERQYLALRTTVAHE